jgi:predicted transcriptional regulator
MLENIVPTHLRLAAEIVSAFVSNNSVPASELPSLITIVNAALKNVAHGAAPKELRPAVPIKNSVTPDFLISLEDGKRYKSLKRHLRTSYNMTPEEYRAKWGLPLNYPMVAPNYAKQRSKLAKAMGLGQQRSNASRRSRKAA